MSSTYRAIDARRTFDITPEMASEGSANLEFRLRLDYHIPEYARATWAPGRLTFEWIAVESELEAA